MFVSESKEYIADWDWEENNAHHIFPNQVTMGSRIRVHWKCHNCGGRWAVQVKERRGCPYCSGFKALPGYNDLATLYPELAKQWVYEKNGKLTPNKVTAGSQKKVFWICEQGHIWDALVRSRVRGQGCPYCNNRRVLKGYNDLVTTNPELIQEWNYNRNTDIDPQDVIAGSKQKVWWLCKTCGYEWQATISNRYRGNGCPVCAGVMVRENVNDLKTRFPEIAAEWDQENNDRKPSEVAPFSRYRASWICPKGHMYHAVVSDRVKGNCCPICSRERRVSFPEKALVYYITEEFGNVEQNYRAEWLGLYELDAYLPEYKIGIEYDGVYGHSGRIGVERDIRKNKVCAEHDVKLLRIREAGCPNTDALATDYIIDKEETLEETISAAISILYAMIGMKGTAHKVIPNIEDDSGAIYSLVEYSEKENSLQNRLPAVAALWHPIKNGKLKPESVSWMSSKIVWWYGSCGHEWRSRVSEESKSGLCPYCIGKRVLIGFNDLETTHPELAAQWDKEKNTPLTPKNVTAGSGKRVWWICDKGHSWQAIVSSRKQGRGCPICANRLVIPGYNDIASNLELMKDWDYNKNPYDPKKVCIGSEKEIWWKCHVCGNSWKVVVSKRYNGSGCPECAKIKRRSSAAKTYVARNGSLQENRPDLIEEWDWNKNKQIHPSEVTCGSIKKAWWICKKCGYQWEASISARIRKYGGGCPQCAVTSATLKRKEISLHKKGSLSEKFPAIASEWDYERNAPLTPDDVTASSGRRVWWICSLCGESWEAVVGERTRRNASVYCLKCRRKNYRHGQERAAGDDPREKKKSYR